jgi:lipoyl-dependent peroxiredoxin
MPKSTPCAVSRLPACAFLSRFAPELRTTDYGKEIWSIYDSSILSSSRFDSHQCKGAIMVKKAWAVWKGSIKEGGGTISTETGVLREAPYGFKSRFEGGKGTNPEELIGAAHAGCFSMAFSLMLGMAGLTPEKIETHADVKLDKVGDGFEITASHLTVTAKIPGASAAQFQEIADKAKAGCPVSKLLKARITMDAKLES